MLVLLSVIVLLMLSAFAIRSSLPSHRRARNNSRSQGGAAPLSNPAARSPPNPSRPPANLQMVHIPQRGYVPSDDSEGPRQQPPGSVQGTERDSELKKWKAVEIFKVSQSAILPENDALRLLADYCQLCSSRRSGRGRQRWLDRGASNAIRSCRWGVSMMR